MRGNATGLRRTLRNSVIMTSAQQQVYKALLDNPYRTIPQMATVTGRSQKEVARLVAEVESIFKQRVRKDAEIVSQ